MLGGGPWCPGFGTERHRGALQDTGGPGHHRAPRAPGACASRALPKQTRNRGRGTGGGAQPVLYWGSTRGALRGGPRGPASAHAHAAAGPRARPGSRTKPRPRGGASRRGRPWRPWRRQSSSMGLPSSWLSSPSCSEEPMRLLRRFPGSKGASGRLLREPAAAPPPGAPRGLPEDRLTAERP